jgi:hypothetical protein
MGLSAYGGKEGRKVGTYSKWKKLVGERGKEKKGKERKRNKRFVCVAKAWWRGERGGDLVSEIAML